MNFVQGRGELGGAYGTSSPKPFVVCGSVQIRVGRSRYGMERR